MAAEHVSDHEYLKKILLAPVYDVAVASELSYMSLLSAELGNEIFLKREDQQPVKSFKLRGAYNRICSLSDEQLQAGVIGASAGNHAQGLAYSAKMKGIQATIVMPETTPDIKVDAVRRFGGENVNVVLHGTSFDQASSHAKALCETHGYTFVPPFDDPDVIAGQGTVARELLEQNPHLDILFIAVGGGGLAAGIAVYLKQLKPSIKIVAVESEESACFIKAKAQGAPTELESGSLVGGFGHHQVLALADKVVDAVKSGAIKRFVVMAGCDGRHKERSYFTEVAETLPNDAVILTAGCAKFRYNKLDHGDIGGIPRLLDAGQCNDCYSLAVIALKLKEVFELEDINDLPISFDIGWFEQKAAAVLLALLHLGVKGIRLGPTLPAFLSPGVIDVLVQNFDIKLTDEPAKDVDLMMQGS